jgi:L-alanine-DL-glutamate epimerase-like enolase superfamily enzyme
MQIETIRAYRVLLPFVDGPYHMSKGRSAEAFDSVIVAITSDDGLTGWGEMAPLGNFYSLPSRLAHGPVWPKLRRTFLAATRAR